MFTIDDAVLIDLFSFVETLLIILRKISSLFLFFFCTKIFHLVPLFIALQFEIFLQLKMFCSINFLACQSNF